MKSYTATVPEGMSYVNAWHALYEGATEVGQFFEMHPDQLSQQQELVSTSEKVANLFKNYPTNKLPLYYMEYEGGKKMKVHFCDFPTLDVYYYDKTYEIGAQSMLDNYSKIASADRFDKNDSYCFTDLSNKS